MNIYLTDTQIIHSLKKSIAILLVLLPCLVIAQNVDIPDAAFKQFLLEESNINTDGNGEISTFEAESYNGGIYIYSDIDVQDLSGINAFVNIKTLRCECTSLQKLHLNNLSRLESLTINSDGLLSDFMIQGLPELEWVDLRNNQIFSTDLTSSPKLERLFLDENKLTSLDLSQNLLLSEVYGNDNLIETLILPPNSQELSKVVLKNNLLSSFSASSYPELGRIDLMDNKLESISLSDLPMLWGLDLSGNLLKEIHLVGDLYYRASLFDLNGRLMISVKNQPSLDVSQYVQGTYLLEIQDLESGQKILERIVVGN